MRYLRKSVKKPPSDIPGALIIEGHIQGLSNTRSLGEIGIPIFVLDVNNCIARYSKYCTKFFRCPTYLDDELAYFLIDLAIKENIKDWVIIPSNDHAVHTLSRFKNELEIYFKIITPNIDTIERIYDKAKLLKLAEKLNIPIPITIAHKKYTKLSGEIFPVIIKGREGLSFYKAAGKKAFLAYNQSEYEDVLFFLGDKISLKDTITQELIPKDDNYGTISYTIFAVQGEVKASWVGEKVREHPFRFGTATFCKSATIPSLMDISHSLIKELKYSGVCEIEYMKDPRDGRFKIIEINPRTWLWTGLAKACGIDYAKMIYNYFHGENEISYPQNTESNTLWANYITDFFYSFKAILRGKLKIKQFIHSYKGKVIRAVYSPSDSRPGIVYLLFLIKYLRQR